MKRLTTPLVMAAIVLGTVFLFACQQPVEMSPEQLSQIEQGLCSADTHCEFYTDNLHAEICGERDMCINCSSANSQWGCVGSQFRECWNMGGCSTHECFVC